MPISGPSSYPATVAAFRAHWNDVNTALGAGHELVLPEGTSLADFDDQSADLDEARDAVNDRGTDQQLARGQFLDYVSALQARMVEFNARVRGDLPGHLLADVLPLAFTVGDAEDVVRSALRKMEYVWGKVNALSPAPTGVTLPYMLSGGYAIAQFVTDRQNLRDAYGTLSAAEVDLGLARAARNKVQEVIYPILKSYRKKIEGFGAAHPDWVATLPTLTPAKGSTPAAVVAHGVWDATEEKAKITWPASSEAALEKYELRGVQGDDYATDDETVLATVLPGAAREALSDFGLGTAGQTSGFKVYVMLTTGNEKGSAPVYVTRPG